MTDQDELDRLIELFNGADSSGALDQLVKPILLGTIPKNSCLIERGFTARKTMAGTKRLKLLRTEIVCHRCDYFACSNPSHLFLGSQADNMLDAKLKRDRGIPSGNDRFLGIGCKYHGWTVLDRDPTQYVLQHKCSKQLTVNSTHPFFNDPLSFVCPQCKTRGVHGERQLWLKPNSPPS